jgi:hypothetical protein
VGHKEFGNLIRDYIIASNTRKPNIHVTHFNAVFTLLAWSGNKLSISPRSAYK